MRRLIPLAWVLLATQVLHGVAAGTGEIADLEGGELGTPAGLAALIGNVVVLVALHRQAGWSPRLAEALGWSVGVGTVLYHALPFESSLTFSYWDAPVNALQWASVVAIVGTALGLAVVAARLELGPETRG